MKMMNLQQEKKGEESFKSKLEEEASMAENGCNRIVTNSSRRESH